MEIHGLQKLTLLDYPEHLACTVFFGACNFRCPFCHNASLVLHPNTQPTIPEEELLAFLKLRKGELEGVCITGGEPTLQLGLAQLLDRIKTLGYDVKLDTNGYRPEVLHNLSDAGLLDYVAMDIKSDRETYPAAAGCPIDITRIEESVHFLMDGSIPYEFRTTCVRELHNADTFTAIGKWLHGARAYYLQSFKDSGDLIGTTCTGFSATEMEQFKSIVAPHFNTVDLRG